MSDERPGGRMTPHPEKRLITIDTETLLRLHKIALDLDENSGDRRGFDVLDSILAAWYAGITRDEIQLLIWAAEESAPHLYTEYEPRRLRLADLANRKLIPLLSDPAPQEAE